MTKSQQLRNTQNFTVKIIKSTGGGMFMLLGKGYMVAVTERNSVVDNGEQNPGFLTHFHRSLPWETVRRIFKKRPGSTGKIRHAWRYSIHSDSVVIGCQMFMGYDFRTLKTWAQTGL